MAFMEDFAQGSNMYAVAVMVSCLAALFVYLYRITAGADWMNSDSRPIAQQTPAQLMENVHNPFVLHIIEPSKASFSAGIRVSVTSKVPCYALAMWGVSIERIYHVIHQAWPQFLEGFMEGILHPLLEGHVLFSQQLIDYPHPVQSSEVLLEPPGSVDMGSPPRDKYPLVIVLLDRSVFSTGSQQRDRSSLQQNVVAMVYLLHVRDSVCPGESQLIAQFVRMYNSNTVFNLQQLYVTGERGDEEEHQNNSSTTTTTAATTRSSQSATTNNQQQPSPTTTTTTTNTSNTHHHRHQQQQLCVVCQSRIVSRVSLPCRHACVCRVCFRRLEKCPMCRAVITSYFSMDPRGEHSDTDSEDGEEEEEGGL